MEECELTGKCEFYQRYGLSRGIIWKVQISPYCHGAMLEYCERRRLILVGVEPPENLMPSGEMPEVLIKVNQKAGELDV